MVALTVFASILFNLQAVWSSLAICVPKHDSFRLLGNNQEVNVQVEKSPGDMLIHEAHMGELVGTICFGKLDLLNWYWQMSLAPQAQ